MGKRLSRHLTNEHRGKHQEKCPVCYVSRELQTRTAKSRPSTPPRMTRTQTLTTPNADKGCGPGLSLPAGGDANVQPFRKGLAVSYKAKHALSDHKIQQLCILCLPKGGENSRPHKSLHAGIYSSVLVQATGMSFSR